MKLRSTKSDNLHHKKEIHSRFSAVEELQLKINCKTMNPAAAVANPSHVALNIKTMLISFCGGATGLFIIMAIVIYRYVNIGLKVSRLRVSVLYIQNIRITIVFFIDFGVNLLNCLSPEPTRLPV